jgi:integrase
LELELRYFFPLLAPQDLFERYKHCHKVLILFITKTLLYTGVRVSELVKIKLSDLDFDAARFALTRAKEAKTGFFRFPLRSRKFW